MSNDVVGTNAVEDVRSVRFTPYVPPAATSPNEPDPEPDMSLSAVDIVKAREARILDEAKAALEIATQQAYERWKAAGYPRGVVIRFADGPPIRHSVTVARTFRKPTRKVTLKAQPTREHAVLWVDRDDVYGRVCLSDDGRLGYVDEWSSAGAPVRSSYLVLTIDTCSLEELEEYRGLLDALQF